MKRLVVLAACMALAACTTTEVKLADDVAKPSPHSRVLSLTPDVELSELQAVGLQQPRADWSSSARDNLSAAIRATLDARGLKYTVVDGSTVTEGRNGQLLRLNATVDTSILLYNMRVGSLPTHKGAFDWTLGDGAKSLGDTYNSDYALYILARGDYSSGGRVAMAILMAAGGVSLPMGHQQLLASLVDLKTGRVVWYNLALASPSADMRSPSGAQELVDAVFKSAPF